MAYGPSTKYFPVRPDLESVNNHFLHIYEHSEDEVRKKKTKICTENLSVVAFAFLAVNNLDV